MATSQNGYTANRRSLVSSRPVPGTGVRLTVRNGAPGWLLIHFAAWFDKHVENIDNARGHLDDWGYAERPIRGSATELSNHASGTAIDLNATRHPMGRRGTFTDAQAAHIRHQLRTVYDGCIRWGGDYHGRPDEMHFEINASPAACRATERRIKSEEDDDMTPEQFLDIKIANHNRKGEPQGTRKLGGWFTDVEATQDNIRHRVTVIEQKLDDILDALKKKG